MKNTIIVDRIEVFAYHGCMPEEAEIGGNFIVNLKLETDFEEAAETDDLSLTIDYVEVYSLVIKEMNIRSKLIEHVGKRILDALKEKFASLSKVSVEIRKINPPINGRVNYVSVILED